MRNNDVQNRRRRTRSYSGSNAAYRNQPSGAYNDYEDRFEDYEEENPGYSRRAEHPSYEYGRYSEEDYDSNYENAYDDGRYEDFQETYEAGLRYGPRSSRRGSQNLSNRSEYTSRRNRGGYGEYGQRDYDTGYMNRSRYSDEDTYGSPRQNFYDSQRYGSEDYERYEESPETYRGQNRSGLRTRYPDYENPGRNEYSRRGRGRLRRNLLRRR